MLKQISHRRNLRRSSLRKENRKPTKSQPVLKISTLVNAFTDKTTFSATLDSKGRLTVPARLRNSLGLEAGEEITLSLSDVSVETYSVEGRQEAIEILSRIEGLKEFSFRDGELKVVRDG